MVYKKIIVLSFILGIFLACTNKYPKGNASNSKVDSIAILIKQGGNANLNFIERKKAIEKAYLNSLQLAKDSTKLTLFSKLSWASYKLKDSLLFRTINKKYIQLAIHLKDSSKQARAHWDYGAFFRAKGIKDSAYYHSIAAYKLYTAKSNPYKSGRVLNLISAIQADVKDYTGSEITGIKALESLKPTKKHKYIASSYTNLAIANTELKEYDKALEFYKKVEEHLNKYIGKDKKELKLSLLNNFAVVYSDNKNYEKAIANYEQVLISDSLYIKDPKFYAKALNNLAYSRFKIGDTINLKQQLLKSLYVRDSIGDIEGLSSSNYNLAEYYLSNKDTLNAIKYTRDAELYARKSSSYSRLLETFQLYTRVDPTNATHYTQQYIALNDSLQLEERKIRNKFARIRFETDEFIEENEILEERQKILLGLIAGVILLSFAIVIIIGQQIKNQKLKFKQQQQENNLEIFTLMLAEQGKLKEVKQQEQQRISREIHDGVVGDFFGVRLMLEGLNDKSGDEAIKERQYYIKELQAIEENIRSLSHQLHTSSHEKIHNFINTIEVLLEKINRYKTLKCHFSYDNNVDWDKFNNNIKINLYRITQECLQNCMKHSKALNASLAFNVTKENIEVTIKDDGIGFVVKRKKKNGIGMKNIASRIKDLNGTWCINSKKDEGTTVTLVIPIVKEEGTNNY